MSHGDHVEAPPPGYVVTAASAGNPIAAFEHESKPIYGVQFHPEVAHTPRGGEIISQLPLRRLQREPSWTPGAFVESEVAKIRELVGDAQVICGLSGGVDSSVAAALVHRAIGDQLTCVFVDTGLLRLHEREQVERTMRDAHGHQARDGRCVASASSTRSPASKSRKRSARSSATRSSTSSRRRRASAGTDAKFLVQGTLYPDVIEIALADAADRR